MIRILFVASHRPGRAPGQRFRFEQYLEYLEENGYQCDVSYLVTEEDDRVLYRSGSYVSKMMFTRRARAIRTADLRRIEDFDLVFVFREALMTRSLAFERAVARSGAKMIFDFDDAIWISNVSKANRAFGWMKNPAKTSDIIAVSDMVFAGNAYLSEYAGQYNENVKVVPTTIDTDQYQPRPPRSDGPVCIGWSGSITTIQHFESALPFLLPLKERFGDSIRIKVIGDRRYRHERLGVEGIGWSMATELTELSDIDIGIMPLPDDMWAKGKCGLKGLQYMALGIPTLMSPVGVNTEIIAEGENGFLPADPEAWVERIATLIEDPALRKDIGAAGRETVVQRYSVDSQKRRYLQYFNELLSS
ncbi:MAG: glycosyltransferase family 4 protein [Gemmatimonadales bacterium]|jgi:glycosyltransferase involved in cell wall biosynthesis|nr:glycosyltransferase family 4 protein [Gemmatimonadales bacterium]MBT3500409.1 glycosyltransferase family 4 protein [Gemmatimonadales bacterium]MBT3773587.1 glycosyltransferase family 4 protein [Gemmatimonadales bacterium]MBT3958840.1 glycosyltransferase family 4 protein [Gemmatimonadales bacterium]MBT4185651.1 glycosyltransferase family 4 protein [Gemmatimonadales bacterium]